MSTFGDVRNLTPTSVFTGNESSAEIGYHFRNLVKNFICHLFSKMSTLAYLISIQD